jgi:hypothetical protein
VNEVEVNETPDGRRVATAEDSRPLALIDIDGVVADVRHRLHHVRRRPKDWDAFFAAAAEDGAHPEGLAVVQTLAADHEIVFLTGRPEWTRGDTVTWLDGHGLGGHRVVMRPAGDHRPAAVVKLAALRHLAHDRAVGIVVDDDVIVLCTMREAGYPVYAADWEQRSAETAETLLAAQERDGIT